MRRHFVKDERDLFWCFARSEHRFGETSSLGALEVQFGKAIHRGLLGVYQRLPLLRRQFSSFNLLKDIGYACCQVFF